MFTTRIFTIIFQSVRKSGNRLITVLFYVSNIYALHNNEEINNFCRYLVD